MARDDQRSEEQRERDRIARERRRLAERGEPQQPAPPSAEPPKVERAASAPPPWQPSQPSENGTRQDSTTARRVVLAIFTLILLIISWFLISLFQPFAGDGKGTGEIPVTVPKGAEVSEIGDLLAANQIISSSGKFKLRSSMSGKSGEFKAGRYVLGAGMSYAATIDQLAQGPNAGTTTVTIPEGRSRYEIAQTAAELGLEGDYMAATKSSSLLNPSRYGAPKSVDSLEGFLFPATYELPAGSNVDKLVPQQLAAFKNSIAEVIMRYAKSRNLTVYDILIIASLIEREVSTEQERKLVSAVIYNRLKAGIPLGIDATTRFETRNWSNEITNAQLRSRTPYNTRLNKGLPPGPIGNPGLASIRAAADPASAKYLFYVANPCKPGTHSFSNTNAEFEQDVARYNEARAKAGGKAPTGC